MLMIRGVSSGPGVRLVLTTSKPDASQRSCCGRRTQRRMGTRGRCRPPGIVTLYLCRKHSSAARPYETPSFRATADTGKQMGSAEFVTVSTTTERLVVQEMLKLKRLVRMPKLGSKFRTVGFGRNHGTAGRLENGSIFVDSSV